MPSPFPGMDPYLEDPAYWSDFHLSYLTYLRDAINDRLPEAYQARIDERTSVGADGPARRRLMRPDVSVVNGRKVAESRGVSSVATLELAPVLIPLVVRGPRRYRYLKILKGDERRLVAVIELLSPSNKVSRGRVDYLKNRDALIGQEVHIVELDLLRRGRRLPLQRPLPPGDYFALVSRDDCRPDCEVYAWTIRQKLPSLPIPLAAPDPDVRVPLAEVFETADDRGRYPLDYGRPPAGPMSAEDLAWALDRAKLAAR